MNEKKSFQFGLCHLQADTWIYEGSYFQVAQPGHTIAYKNVDNLLKNS